MILAQKEGQTVTQNLKQVDTTSVARPFAKIYFFAIILYSG